MKSWMQGIPELCFDQNCLTEAEQQALLAPVATVAQKCTGRAKKPVFLFPTKVVKGLWFLSQEGDRVRVQRELGRTALISAWALPNNPCPVVVPRVFAEASQKAVYLVWEALYPAPTPERPWEIESRSQSVSAVGPRTLEVVSRASNGVVRVSDRAKQEPAYLIAAFGIWEHLVHRCLLQCGDSGLHNMLVHPTYDCVVGVDLDEWRNRAEQRDSWWSLLFRKPPAKKWMGYLEQGVQTYAEELQALLAHLRIQSKSATSIRLAVAHDVSMSSWSQRLDWLQHSLDRLLEELYTFQLSG